MQQPPITNNFRRRRHCTHLYPLPETTDRQNLTPPHAPKNPANIEDITSMLT
ncbi:hypothetical protein XFPR_12380 [Xylella fastidiosa]|nr:hypothetical protein [Xylella fastidiosa]MDG5823519.1 hypothetical protein [Xylella fastidiosa subsp. pauca]QPB72644.1 hypothetical protein XFHB_13335 [Xylella fastidiosa]QPB72979.1 hypothetical protein XFPR_12380 [Xylella fastidiosa]QPB73285.1 hypothetical protein XFC3_12710 [Xylella fastidiosa]WGZ32380.1 hypothetical protein O4444_01745 [Xylella fastidiosa subsp. pauca]